jgi:hypothetical protein
MVFVQGSKLGKMSRSRIERQSANGRYTVEWEILEWNDDDSDPSPGKRKLVDVNQVDDTNIKA